MRSVGLYFIGIILAAVPVIFAVLFVKKIKIPFWNFRRRIGNNKEGKDLLFVELIICSASAFLQGQGSILLVFGGKTEVCNLMNQEEGNIMEENSAVRDEAQNQEPVQEELQRLKEALEKQEKESIGYLEQIKRLQADFENWRKRIESEKQFLVEHANSSLIKKLLPVLDNFELALASSSACQGGKTEIQEGVSLICRQISDLLKDEGLTVIESVGKEFDPNYHEAISYEEREEGEDHTVIEEVRKGYIFKGKVLRPALVKVLKVSEGARK